MAQPDTNLENPVLDSESSEKVRNSQQRASNSPRRTSSAQGESDNDGLNSSNAHNELLETMIEATERLNIDDQGNCNYRGQFAGLTLLEGIRERCDQMLHNGSEKRDWYLTRAFDAPDLSESGAAAFMDKTAVLPSRETARRLVAIALDDACCLMTFVHRPTFNKLFDRTYELNKDQYSTDEQKFLPLLYEVLALGELFLAEGTRSVHNDCVDESRRLGPFHPLKSYSMHYLTP